MEETLDRLNKALGFKEPILGLEEVVREIYRLREAAGELERPELTPHFETMTVASVGRVPGSDHGPTVTMLLHTKAQVIEGGRLIQGEPPREEIFEIPARNICFFLEEEQARTMREILDERIRDWDGD